MDQSHARRSTGAADYPWIKIQVPIIKVFNILVSDCSIDKHFCQIVHLYSICVPFPFVEPPSHILVCSLLDLDSAVITPIFFYNFDEKYQSLLNEGKLRPQWLVHKSAANVVKGIENVEKMWITALEQDNVNIGIDDVLTGDCCQRFHTSLWVQK